MARGGYQKPTNPAATSGPGKFARRTDGGPAQPQRIAPGGAYGERTEMQAIQSAAPMAASGSPTPGGDGVDPMASVTPFGAPSERPDEPVTHGNPLGAGAGPEALGLPQQGNPELAAWKAKYLPVVEHLAYSKDSTDTIRNLYRFLRGQ